VTTGVTVTVYASELCHHHHSHPAINFNARNADDGRLVFRNDVISTSYANDMLFWQCGESSGFYYAGQRGGTSRFETRRPHNSPCRLPFPGAEEA
jgi:hypothetical protein